MAVASAARPVDDAPVSAGAGAAPSPPAGACQRHLGQRRGQHIRGADRRRRRRRRASRSTPPPTVRPRGHRGTRPNAATQAWNGMIIMSCRVRRCARSCSSTAASSSGVSRSSSPADSTSLECQPGQRVGHRRCGDPSRRHLAAGAQRHRWPGSAGCSRSSSCRCAAAGCTVRQAVRTSVASSTAVMASGDAARRPPATRPSEARRRQRRPTRPAAAPIMLCPAGSTASGPDRRPPRTRRPGTRPATAPGASRGVRRVHRARARAS